MNIKELVKITKKMISEGKKPIIIFPRRYGKTTIFKELNKIDGESGTPENNT